MKVKVLFVCLGNICRSPMAEGSFKSLLNQKGFEKEIICDSAGTSAYHIGELPDKRMCQTALGYDISLTHRARQLKKEDFEEFDYILAMDRSNYQNILKIQESSGKASVMLFRKFDDIEQDHDVPDPYYGGPEGFEEVYRIVERCGKNFLDYLVEKYQF